MVIHNDNSVTTWQKVNSDKFIYWSMLLQTHQNLIALHHYSSGVATNFGPPPQTTCLGLWPRGYGDYFFLASPWQPLQPRGPPQLRGLRGPRYATALLKKIMLASNQTLPLTTNCVFLHTKLFYIQQSRYLYNIVSLFHLTLCLQDHLIRFCSSHMSEHLWVRVFSLLYDSGTFSYQMPAIHLHRHLSWEWRFVLGMTLNSSVVSWVRR